MPALKGVSHRMRSSLTSQPILGKLAPVIYIPCCINILQEMAKYTTYKLHEITTKIRQKEAKTSLSIFYRYFHRNRSQLRDIIPVPLRRVRTTRSSTHSHPFQVSLPTHELYLTNHHSPQEHAVYEGVAFLHS